MSTSFEGSAGETRPGRWDVARLDFDDPRAPLKAKFAEVARVMRRTDFIDEFDEHPEYDETDFEILGQLIEVRYQSVTQDCDVIVTQLRDNPDTKLEPEQRKLVLAVLGLPPKTLNTKIIAAHQARTHYMQVINLAVAFRTSLRDLPDAIQNALAPETQPLTDDDIASSIVAYETLLMAEHDSEDNDYNDFDWYDGETDEEAAIRMAEEQLGHRELPHRYKPTLDFDITKLYDLSFEDIFARHDDELRRVLRLRRYLPAIEQLQAVTWHKNAANLNRDESMLLLEAMELYLGWCLNKLDSAETLAPVEKRYVRKMLGLPRNSPTILIYETYHQRTLWMDYVNTRLTDRYASIPVPAFEQPEPVISDRPLVDGDVEAAIQEFENILAAAKAAIEMSQEVEAKQQSLVDNAIALMEATASVNNTQYITRADMVLAVRAATQQIREAHWSGEDDDDEHPGDIFVA